MGLDDLLGDGETKTGSFFIFAAGEIRLVETVPDQADAVLGDTDAVVFDGYQQFVGLSTVSILIEEFLWLNLMALSTRL